MATWLVTLPHRRVRGSRFSTPLLAIKRAGASQQQIAMQAALALPCPTALQTLQTLQKL